ncbi:hypothetical protein J2T17_007471 [Paenibacillus mucilaginosus]|uniref:YodL domain-containing protein n=1 Tax=Paenibacillus mucilaginosus TaxID=61624 RepID=UPI003D1C8BE3
MSNSSKYTIYQVRRGLTREFGYMGFEEIKSLEIKVDLANYDKVYSGEVEVGGGQDGDVLETLFMIFNTDHPQDYKGRSLSVSDIVELNGEVLL